MRFKIWLRGPSDGPRVELIAEYGWHSGHLRQRKERSIMAELHSLEESDAVQVSEGVWLFLGTPP